MALSNDLISQFVKATKDTQTPIKDVNSYGTIVKDTTDGKLKVQIDGSDSLIPVTTQTIVVGDGDRVVVNVKNHTATVTGNLKNPAIRKIDTVTQADIDEINQNAANAAKSATDFLGLSDQEGFIIGNLTEATLGGNIQLKAESGGASISLRDGQNTLAKFIAYNKTFSGVTSASTTIISDTETVEDDSGTVSETVTGSSQTVVVNQAATVVKFESSNPIYFSSGIRTDGVIIGASNFITNVDLTLNGKIFDKNGKNVLDPVTSEGNLSIGYGRFKNATSSSKDYTIVYGNKVRLTTKNGATITQDGSAVLESQNGNGNMVLGYHLYKKKKGNTNIYAGDNVTLTGKSVNIIDSTGNACFEAKNDSGNTTIGYARYANSGNTNIYGGTELNLFAKSGGTIIANSAFVPSSNASLALGKAGSLGWSNIYLGNASGSYNGLRMIVGGANENLCGRDEDGRYIFGNAGSVMHYRAKDVSSTDTGNAFRITSGNDGASNNTSSIWFFGAADSTSRYIGSYLAYNRTYSTAANMVVTANGVFGRYNSSSERYKEDITIADLDSFKGLYNLPVKKFKYKSGYLCEEDERCGQYLYGFIVEDLVDVLPCAVDHVTNQNGESIPEMWNSNILIPALLKLIQDLNNRLTTLEAAN